MTEYAPTTEQMREWFAEPSTPKEPTSIDRHYRYKRMFDRWLSELIRKEREEAVDHYAAQVNAHIEMWGTAVDEEPWPENPYRRE